MALSDAINNGADYLRDVAVIEGAADSVPIEVFKSVDVIVADPPAICERLHHAENLKWFQVRRFTIVLKTYFLPSSSKSSFAGVDALFTRNEKRDFLCTRSAGWCFTYSHLLLTLSEGIFGDQMASYCMGWILGLERKIPLSFQLQNQRTWGFEEMVNLRNLSDLTVGVLGAGSIGQSIAAAAKVSLYFDNTPLSLLLI